MVRETTVPIKGALLLGGGDPCPKARVLARTPDALQRKIARDTPSGEDLT